MRRPDPLGERPYLRGRHARQPGDGAFIAAALITIAGSAALAVVLGLTAYALIMIVL